MVMSCVFILSSVSSMSRTSVLRTPRKIRALTDATTFSILAMSERPTAVRATHRIRRSRGSNWRTTHPLDPSRSIKPPKLTLPKSILFASADWVSPASPCRESTTSTQPWDAVSPSGFSTLSRHMRRRRETSWINGPILYGRLRSDASGFPEIDLIGCRSLLRARTFPGFATNTPPMCLEVVFCPMTLTTQVNEIPSATREIKGKIRVIAKSWSSPARLVVASFAITTS